MTKEKYTPDEATQKFLDLMKRANPSTEVRVVITEIEGEMSTKSSARPMKRRRHKAAPASKVDA